MASSSNGGYEFVPLYGVGGTEEVTPMDPRLQRLLALQQQGRSKPATASTVLGEVAVMAKVSDVEAWEALSEVQPGVVIGEAGHDGAVVTARLPVSRVEHVRSQPFVMSLKAAQFLHRTLADTTREIGARPEHMPAGVEAAGGRGAIVGIVDGGCGFAHRNFVTRTGRTRLLRLWDQDGSGNGVGGFDYGTVHERAAIDAALKKADPYAALGYEPGSGAHGTHVMDIAAGNGQGTGRPGVATAARLVFVDVAASDIPWTGPLAVGRTFGDSVHLLEALAFIFETAETAGRPCVINVSLGTNGGPHDGSSLVEQGIDSLVTQAPNRAVVIAASNSFDKGIHAAGTVPKTAKRDLGWTIASGDGTSNELELWYRGADRLSVELLAPDGTSIGTLQPGQSGTVNSRGRAVLFAANRLHDPNNGDNMIGIFLAPAAPSGRWTLRLRSKSQRAVSYHAWIERDDDGQSTFEAPLDNSHTIGSISCGHQSVVVGSYDAHKPALPLSYFSSAGPTRDGRQKPEVSAPGHSVLAANSGTLNRALRKSGTSMAAPAVTGCIALLLAEARARQAKLTVDQIRQAVIETARTDPPPVADGEWDPRYGFGRISAADLVAKQII